MILEREPLQPDVQPPRELIVHRNSEINRLSSLFEPVTEGYETKGAYIHGPPGSGKTCAARVLLDELPGEVAPEYTDGDDSVAIETAYLDCTNGKARRQIYQELLQVLGDGPAETRQSVSNDALKARTESLVSGHLVVVLDEADQIGDKAVLKELYEMTGVTLLPIVNETHRLFADAEDRLDSRLNALTPVRFKVYDESTLVEILEKRINVGLEKGVISDSQIEAIAGLAHNDARLAICILHNAVELARTNGRGSVSDALIREAVPMAEPDVIQSHLSALTRRQRVCLEVIGEVGPAKSGAICDAYCASDRVTEDRSQRTIRDWLSDFEDRQLVRSHETGNGPKYELRDHTREALEERKATVS